MTTMTTMDRNAAAGTTALIAALRAGGYDVQTPVTGSVIVDGDEISPAAWDRMVMEWDGSANGLEDMGWKRAADAMRDEWPIVELCDYSRFETAGADQGQIVLVSYAWADGDLIRRREDQSEKPGSVDRVTYSVARDALEEDGLGEGSTVDDWAAAAAGLDWERCSVRE